MQRLSSITYLLAEVFVIFAVSKNLLMSSCTYYCPPVI
jgi:hypothetical protein